MKRRKAAKPRTKQAGLLLVRSIEPRESVSLEECLDGLDAFETYGHETACPRTALCILGALVSSEA